MVSVWKAGGLHRPLPGGWPTVGTGWALFVSPAFGAGEP